MNLFKFCFFFKIISKCRIVDDLTDHNRLFQKEIILPHWKLFLNLLIKKSQMKVQVGKAQQPLPPILQWFPRCIGFKKEMKTN